MTIVMLYLDGFDTVEIGTHLGISGARVRQVLAVTEAPLRVGRLLLALKPGE